MPDSTENLLKRTHDQLCESNERCVVTAKTISLSAVIIALSRETILHSRQQIARLREGQAVGVVPPVPVPILGQ